jgi:outer membrane protein assembly factor BamB
MSAPTLTLSIGDVGRVTAVGTSLVLVVALTTCAPDGPTPARQASVDRCQWAMLGRDATRSFATPCPTPIAPDTVAGLEQAWFFGTDDAVTATPAVVDDVVYVGDWSGRFYAVDLATGELLWSHTADPHPAVYAGQIVSSAAVADVDGERTVYFGSGKTVHALRADDGSVRWEQELGRPGDGSDPTEVESSPVVADGVVIVGTDVHNSQAGEPAGIHAFDAATGRPRWSTITAPSDDPEPTGPGCGDVWGSPTVDLDRRLVFAGTGNCSSDDGWGPNSEALLALDLDTGARVWGFQPHEANHDDLDFAGAPNLFEVDGRPAVGLGNKDGAYYAVDRSTGELLWQRPVADAGISEPGSDFSTGGFIGPTALAAEGAAAGDGAGGHDTAADDGAGGHDTAADDGAGGHDLVVGGTAVGGDPYVHAIDAATGEIAWQQPAPGPTYAPSAVAGGVVFLGGIDYTFRAFDLRDGSVLWEQPLSGAVSGGAAVVGGDVVVVAGMREPGVGEPLRTAGVYRFTLDPVAAADETTGTDAAEASPGSDDGGDGSAPAGDATTGQPSSSASTSTSGDPPTSGTVEVGPASSGTRPEQQPCIAEPCELGFELTSDRVGGDTGSGTVHIGLDPFEVVVETEGLGDPTRWLRPGSLAAQQGATAYAVYLSQGTDDPVGGLVCVLDAEGDCTGDRNPAPGASYDRISILSVADPSTFPSIAEGFDRLITTNAFAVPFAPAG